MIPVFSVKLWMFIEMVHNRQVLQLVKSIEWTYILSCKNLSKLSNSFFKGLISRFFHLYYNLFLSPSIIFYRKLSGFFVSLFFKIKFYRKIFWFVTFHQFELLSQIFVFIWVKKTTENGQNGAGLTCYYSFMHYIQ